MARPCKSANVLADYSRNLDEIEIRKQEENNLKGGDKINLLPPSYLNKNQKTIFKYIVKMLKESNILGVLDVYILSTCAISIERLQFIEKSLNADLSLLTNNNLLSAKDKYTKDFMRCCNELCLSPQSRAKMANINLQSKREKDDILLKILNGKDDDIDE